MTSLACRGSSRGGMLHTVTFEAADCAVCTRSLYADAISSILGSDSAQLFPPQRSTMCLYLIPLSLVIVVSSVLTSATLAPRIHTTWVFAARFSSKFLIRLLPITSVLPLDWRSLIRWISYVSRVLSLVIAVTCSRSVAFCVLSIPHSFTAASCSLLVSVIALVKSAMALSISDDSWSSFSLAFRKSSARCLHDKQDHTPPISACGISRHLQWYHVIHRQHRTMSPPDRPLRCWHPGMQWLDSGAVTEPERFGFRGFDFPNDFDDFSLTAPSAFPVAPSVLVAETSEFTSPWPSSVPGCTASPIGSSTPTTGWVVAAAVCSLAAHAFDILSARIFSQDSHNHWSLMRYSTEPLRPQCSQGAILMSSVAMLQSEG